MKHALQVYLDDPDFRALVAWSRERGWTLSQAVRLAVKALTRSAPGQDPLLAASGMVHGLPADLSGRIDEYLEATFVADPPARHGKTTRRRRTR